VFRCLEDNYLNADVPTLHTCFFDIEVDFDKERGFAPPEDPFNKVTAITLYLDWADALITLCIPPTHMSPETAQEIVDQFENTYICKNETEMFNMFFDIIEDADVLTGWNSSGFDIPYMVNRITRVMSKDDTRRFCLWKQLPKKRKFMRFDQEQETFDLIGRIHMDYLELYKKYNYESRHSYKLDFIGEMEVGENKTLYEGTLDQLYNKDWKKFLEYNRQDTMLLFKIHDKLKFLDLACSIAHQNTVLLQTAMGSVALIEQAVINEAHSRGLIVPNKQRDFDDYDSEDGETEDGAVGAYVAYPKKGMHEWIAAVDLNSLYPSTIRALNMAPETIIGQLRPVLTDKYIAEKMKNPKVSFAAAWEGVFGSLEYTAVMNQERGTMITVDWEKGGSDELSAAEVWKLIFDSNQPWMLTANGTIFTYQFEGVIPGLLTKWYSERKDLQKKAKNTTDKAEFEYYDKRQLVRKILLNSAYGALLNKHCRFYDKRIGQSTTLTGRQIVKHMSAYLNEAIAGEYDHTGESIIYNDTDSAYFTAWPTLSKDPEMAKSWNKEVAIEIYDQLGESVNQSFPEFMERAFHCPRKNGEIIKAGREIVADRGIFVTKKKYAVNVYDKEGKRKDLNGKMGDVKVTGLDIKRSDTPKFIQDFLMKVLTQVLAGKAREDVVSAIREFKEHLQTLQPWEKGSPKGVKKLTSYEEKVSMTNQAQFGKFAAKVNMPGHTRASMNWNYLRKLNGDNYTMKIVDGMKIVVCKLKDNPLGFTSIAYPVDETRLPDWFKSMPFDDAAMEQALVDEKIENILGVLDWKLRDSTNIRSTFETLFSFE
jgi:DNA polymerase elongation subunit (family B)